MTNTPPHSLNGLSPSKLYLPNVKELQASPRTVFEYVCKKFPHISQAEWQARFDAQLICIEDNAKYFFINTAAPYAQWQNKTLYYYRQLKKEIKIPFDYHIIFENDYFMVIDKPHFLPMTPTGDYVNETLLTRLKRDTKIETLSPIHRLDKETAGLVLFCKQQEHRSVYQSLFANQQIKKTYHAIAPFDENLHFPINLSLALERAEPFYTMKVGSHQINSHSLIDILEIGSKKDWAKYQLIPSTGKLHQLRVHMNYLGIPIKNDPYYPIVNHKPKDDFSKPLQLLAKSLLFLDPITGNYYEFFSKQSLKLT